MQASYKSKFSWVKVQKFVYHVQGMLTTGHQVGKLSPLQGHFQKGVEGCDKILQLDHPINQNGHPLQYIQKVQYTIPTVWKKSKLSS